MKKLAALALIVAIGQLFGCTGSRFDLLGKDHIRMTTVDTNWFGVRLRFGALASEVDKTLGKPVTIAADWDTDAIKTHLADEHVKDYYHLMYLEPAEFCQVSEAAKLTPLALRKNARGEHTEIGLIVVPTNSPIKGLQDLAGKRFAFGPYGSTYMFYNVLELFRDANVPVSLIKSVGYCNDSLGVVQNLFLALGAAHAGVVTKTWWETTTDRTLDMSTLLKDELRIIAETKPMPELIWAATDALTAHQQGKLKELFTQTLTHKPLVFSPFQARGFAPPDEKIMAQLCERLKQIKNIPNKPKLLP